MTFGDTEVRCQRCGQPVPVNRAASFPQYVHESKEDCVIALLMELLRLSERRAT